MFFIINLPFHFLYPIDLLFLAVYCWIISFVCLLVHFYFKRKADPIIQRTKRIRKINRVFAIVRFLAVILVPFFYLGTRWKKLRLQKGK